MYDFLQAVEGAVSEGFSKVADDLLTTSRNKMSEVDTVKLFRDEEIRKNLDCDVPSMYNIIIALLEGMKICCHERLWNGKYAPRQKFEDPEIKNYEAQAAEEKTKKKCKKKTTKKEPKNKEVVSSGVKKVITNGGKKTK